MTDRDSGLLKAIARRNWVILATMLLASLAWRSAPVTLAVACGGLIAIIGHSWRHRELKIMLEQAAGTRRFQVGYLVRLAVLAITIYLLIVPMQLPPVPLVAGLSVVVINILFTTVTRAY